MEEFWKDIPGYEGLYKISNLGNIISIHNDYRPNKGERPIKNIKMKIGYLSVGLSKNFVKKRFYVHRLVMLAFCGECKDDEEVNHKDGNKANPSLENLEYITHSRNVQHGVSVLGKKFCGRIGVDNWNTRFTENQIFEIRKRITEGEKHSKIARDYGVSSAAIYAIAKRKSWGWLTEHK